MARLNDVPDAESVESLKRRFIRQNREIARANSTQSIRIRTLESEVTHLLTENVSLREASIHLNQELEYYRNNTMLGEQISTMKEKLESKLFEIANLVTDLGGLSLQHRNTIQPPENESSIFHNTLPRKSMHGITEKPPRLTPLHGEDGRLPAIVEDAASPQEFSIGEEISPPMFDNPDMEVQEDKILETTAEDHELQDSHDPITPSEDTLITADKHSKVELSRRSSKGRSKEKRKYSSTSRNIIADTTIDEQEANPAPLTKPKHSSISRNITTDTTNDERETQPAPPTKTKTSSKRKLDIQPLEISSSRRGDDSEKRSLTRPTAIALSPTKTKTDPENEQPLWSPQKDRRATLVPISNRALKPKNTNTRLRSNVTSDGSLLKGDVEVSKPRRESRPRSKPRVSGLIDVCLPPPDQMGPLDDGPAEVTVEDKFEDNGILDINFDCTEDKTTQKNDAPAENEDVKSATRSRQPRRSRGTAVSYAEPSLRGKMRRPTHELVAAVEQGRRLSRLSADSEEIGTKEKIQLPQPEQPVEMPDDSHVAEEYLRVTQSGRSRSRRSISTRAIAC